jgi:hypothetical protein
MDTSLSSSKTRLERLELGVAVALTVATCYLHLTFMRHAGGLWRDEVVSFNVATQPTLGLVHEAVRYDSFPSFFHLLLRGWLSLGLGDSDLGARCLGLLIGVSVLGAFWWNARVFGARFPLFSLLLVGISGLCVRTTDAIRGYGIGALCIALCFGLIWKVATAPTTRNVVLATLLAILSVQSLYQNAFLLGAICLAGALVVARHGLWRRAALILGIGLCAALSLTVYIDAMQSMSEIKPLIPARAGLDRILEVALVALRDGSNLRQFLWLGLLAAFAVVGTREIGKPIQLGAVAEERVLYALASVVVALGAFFVWLNVLGFPTQPWYYVPPMLLLCLAFDAAWPALVKNREAQLARVGAVMAAGVLGLSSAYSGVQIRQTNVDVLAERLRLLAAPEDLIVVDQWYNGTTFKRYFKGPTAWTTLPPLTDQSLQRLDLFKQFMMQSDPIAPVERQILDTLKAGHRVWLAGGLPMMKKGKPVPELPPAPNSPVGWDHDAYSYVWAMQIGELLQNRAAQMARVELPLEGQVNKFENLPLLVVQGWRENPPTSSLVTDRR